MKIALKRDILVRGRKRKERERKATEKKEDRKHVRESKRTESSRK
jgi:hypothetical protein